MMPSLLLNLESACEITVLPQPKAPGIAQVPPRTAGKRPSSTRWPVSSGSLASSLALEGRGARTGQSCSIENAFAPPWDPGTSSSRTFSSIE